jgi:hypothetical protein
MPGGEGIGIPWCPHSPSGGPGAVRLREDGDDAHRRLPVVLRMRAMPRLAEAQAGRLLRVLLVWHRALPADTAGGDRLLRLTGHQGHRQIFNLALVRIPRRCPTSRSLARTCGE